MVRITVVPDNSGSVEAKIWDIAGNELFGMSANRFTEERLKAMETQETKDAFAKSINARLQNKYTLAVSVKLLRAIQTLV